MMDKSGKADMTGKTGVPPQGPVESLTAPQKLLRLIRRYGFFLITLAGLAVIWLVSPPVGVRATDTILSSFKEMLLIIPPVFILLGLLDVWVPRETMIRYMGEKSGLVGILLAILLGSAAAGPLYGAFPVAVVFMRKGARFSNVLLFLGAWSTTKIPMLLFEVASMGVTFTLVRLACSMVGIFFIAFVVERSLGRAEIDRLYEKAARAE